ncbi:hypothetical protein [Cellulosimicrobium arenosum]|uniref:Alpha-L-rhamnosidase six-hairpin glycosidase domain-containing protein n=1 Tax=Cellulosimicrobium arenosum TaxID=2708133 RepID=A0A927G8G9_9MICO|nr:hypothetical protein [Cellulosimicrobium arenosum]MBD8078387.1 hypothetical protein [Cellulosimicrobium arenosum]
MSRALSAAAHQGRPTRSAGALALALSLPLALALPGAAHAQDTPAGGAPSAQTAPAEHVTSDDLADSGEYQQHWSSVPGSRIVLNPFDRDGAGTQLDQNAGPNLPLHVGYYAADEALLSRDLLQVMPVAGETPTDEGYARALAASFDTLSGWTTKDVSTSLTNGQAVLTLDQGKAWGHIAKRITVDDTADARYLTVDVAALTGGAGWNAKVAVDGGADLPQVRPDSTETGTATFDLAAAYGWGHEPLDLTVKVYATNASGAAAGSVALRSLTLDNGGTSPDDADEADAGFVDDFDDASPWTTSRNGATLRSDGSQGTVGTGDVTHGAVERTVTVDLDRDPLLTVDVPQTSAKWALKVSDGGKDVDVQWDTDRTGVLTYDLAGLTGWSGEKTFTVKLFHVGRSGWTAFDRLAIHGTPGWLESASDVGSTWHAAALDADASYSSGATLHTADVFHDETSFSRTIDADGTDGVGVVGAYDGDVSYDADASVLTVRSEHEVYAVDLPEGTDVRYAASLAGLGATSSTPTGTSGAWIATVPSGRTVLGLGFAVDDDLVDPDPVAAAGERAAAATQDPEGDRETWTAYWDEYLATVPVPEDFSLQGVDAVGVEPADVERFYYQGWVNIEQNVLPATPETGNAYVQIGTGKPSMWMKGTPGTKNVASWDSLLGMQDLVHVDPDTAWGAFEGMMALVDDEGGLGGESLPSRKAQTALVLQQVTGETDRLEGVYDDLARHLRWESQNLAWKNPGTTPSEHERDAEFVVSLLVDLQYAQEVSTIVDRPEDVAEWQGIIDDLLPQYQDWFFEDDGTTYQKVWLDDSKQPDVGLTQYVATGLHVPGLDDVTVDRLTARFDSEYDPDEQFAGLAAEAIKAPDAQLMIYGLLDQGDVERAEVLANSITRDMVRSGWFAEVYQETGEGLDSTPIARGVRPSLFGISQLIDNVWMANGYRLDQGRPSFLRMPGREGGITGLTHGGESFDVDLTAQGVTLSGAGSRGLCTQVDVAEGETVRWADAACDGDPQVEVRAEARCLAGTAYVAVRAENVGADDATVRLVTPYGERSGVAAPGSSVYQSFSARADHLDAGEADVVVTRAGAPSVTVTTAFAGTDCS